MRYAQGGGLTAEGRKRREQVRLEAARRFEQGAPAAVIAAELRVSERSVRRWRQAWRDGRTAALRSKGPVSREKLSPMTRYSCARESSTWRVMRWAPLASAIAAASLSSASASSWSPSPAAM